MRIGRDDDSGCEFPFSTFCAACLFKSACDFFSCRLLETMQSPPEEVESVPEEVLEEPKSKAARPRTDLQKAALEKARVKALQVRQENAALRKRERELDVARAAKVKEDRSRRVQEEYEDLQRPKVVTAPSVPTVPEDDDEDDTSSLPPKTKRKRRIIVTEAEESDEDIEVVLPKKRAIPQDEVKMQRLMEKMFTM